MIHDRRTFLGLAGSGAAAFALFGCSDATAAQEKFELTLSDAQWKAKLSPAAYKVLRHEDTERPFSSPLNDEHRAGIFACAGCALPAFSSKAKFDSADEADALAIAICHTHHRQSAAARAAFEKL